MRTQTLGVVSLSTLSLLTGSVLAKVQSRSGRHGHLKYKGFAYPPRANVQDLKDNQVDLGYEIHEGKLSPLTSKSPILTVAVFFPISDIVWLVTFPISSVTSSSTICRDTRGRPCRHMAIVVGSWEASSIVISCRKIASIPRLCQLQKSFEPHTISTISNLSSSLLLAWTLPLLLHYCLAVAKFVGFFGRRKDVKGGPDALVEEKADRGRTIANRSLPDHTVLPASSWPPKPRKRKAVLDLDGDNPQ
ncbi:hypothetical protein DL95DRAFT_410813 [Leptodontidium sp. 2 PMI_412]|nr:hypothetical protein DL95DRAFT_410813 [Leptodontidium sp. 2 PMI_412]